MKHGKLWLILLVLALGLMGGFVYNVSAQEAESGSTPLRKIVVFRERTIPEEREGVVVRQGCRVIKHLPLINAVVVMLPAERPEQSRGNLTREPLVVRVDDDLVVQAIDKPVGVPSAKPPKTPQPSQELPWGINRIDADLAWFSSRGIGVRVAIIDTGIDIDHPDLQANIKGGVNTINPNRSYDDDNGHGTHCAGTVGAVDNGIGVIGVAPEAELYAVKVLNRNGSGWLSDVIEGLQWTIDNGIQVNSMSFGSSIDNISFHEAISKVYNAGITQVAAAGNNGTRGGAVDYPAKYSEVIAVSAIDQNDGFAGFSSYGPEIDLTAPGVKIKSTYKGGGYKELDGTSMSCPHISGTAALKLYLEPSLGPSVISEALKNSAEKLADLTDEEQGAGLVDAGYLIEGLR